MLLIMTPLKHTDLQPRLSSALGFGSFTFVRRNLSGFSFDFHTLDERFQELNRIIRGLISCERRLI